MNKLYKKFLLNLTCIITLVLCSFPAMASKASWYGPGFHGKTTASGEKYNMWQRTAAHKTLPFGSKVRVTNKQNGKSVIVRINDRGPFTKGRVIDLSKRANLDLECDLCDVDLKVLE